MTTGSTMSDGLGFGEALVRAALTCPNEEAVMTARGASLAFADWERTSRQLAASVAERTSPGDAVLFYVGEGDVVAAALALAAILRAGCFAVPLSTRLVPAEVMQVTSALGAAAVLASPQTAESLRLAGAEPLIAEHAEHAEHTDVDVPEPPRAIDRLGGGCVIYTSGTTGVPKGVCCPEEDLRQWWEADGPTRSPYVYQYPVEAAGGVYAVLRALSQHPVMHVGVLNVADLLGAIDRLHPKQVGLVPAGVASLRQRVTSIDGGLSAEGEGRLAVERVFLTAAPSTDDAIEFVRRFFANASVVNRYASTEAGRAHTEVAYPPWSEDPVAAPRGKRKPHALRVGGGLVRVGWPGTNSEVRVTGSDGATVPPGVSGAVWLRHRGSARSYFRDQQASAAVFDDGWVRTGDLGILDDDGELYLSGRDVDTINRGGMKISAQQVEFALRAHPSVDDAAVIGVADAHLGQEPAAAVVASADVDEDELRQHVTTHLGANKTPRWVIPVDELPRNAMGKIDRRRLAELVDDALALRRAGRARSTEDAATGSGEDAPPRRDRFETTVRLVWRSVLGDDAPWDFYEAGGYSLAAVELSALLEERLGVETSPLDLFDCPTPDELVDLLLARATGS